MMTNPMDTGALEHLIDELLVDSDDDDDEDISISDDFYGFLTTTETGPRLDHETVSVLTKCGVIDEGTFFAYAGQAFSTMVSGLSGATLKTISKNGFAGMSVYATYVRDNGLLDAQGQVLFQQLDSKGYQLYWRTNRRRVKGEFQEAVEEEIASRVAIRERRRTRLSTLQESLHALHPSGENPLTPDATRTPTTSVHVDARSPYHPVTPDERTSTGTPNVDNPSPQGGG
jgi:hypothetical protein